MPAFVPANPALGLQAGLAVKAVTIFPDNPGQNLPVIQGAVLVFDPANGKSLALMDGAAMTAIRTGAGSGVATDMLARPESRTLAIIGAGAQALTQIQGICAVRQIDEVWLFDHNADRAERLAETMANSPDLPRRVNVLSDAAEAVMHADIVCTATTSRHEVFPHKSVRAGTHINAIGAYRPDMREISAATLANSRLFVDSRTSCLAEAGDILQAIKEGAIAPGHIAGEIGEVIAGTLRGREFADQITVFKSVGMAVQDAAAASAALANARAQGIGKVVDW